MKVFLTPKLIHPVVIVLLLTSAVIISLSDQILRSHAVFVQAATTSLPRFNHIVVVVEENHSYSQIIGSSSAPYINSLVKQGTLFTDSHSITHPSEPNYLALFAGSTFGLSNDACPENFSPPDLGGQLLAHSLSFAGYSESMPTDGYTGCLYPSAQDATYARWHNPWADFSDTAGAKTNLTFTSFPTAFSRLPTISLVVPNLQDDMHSTTVTRADTWLKNHLDSYVQWAKTNNSLFILTWDEDNDLSANHIPTIFVGAQVKVAYRSSTNINHYNVLHTLEDIFGLACIRASCNAGMITGIWM